MRYTSVVLVCLIHTFLHSMRCWYACLACFVPPVWLSLLLCIFTRLPTCSCMNLCVVHTPIQWNYEHSIQIYICPLKTPSFVWSYVCFPFRVLSMFVCPCLASFPCLSLAWFFLPFVSLLVCWLVSFFFACTHMDWGHLKQGCDLLDASKKGKDASSQKAMFSRLGGLAPPKRSSLSLSL